MNKLLANGDRRINLAPTPTVEIRPIILPRIPMNSLSVPYN